MASTPVCSCREFIYIIKHLALRFCTYLQMVVCHLCSRTAPVPLCSGRMANGDASSELLAVTTQHHSYYLNRTQCGACLHGQGGWCCWAESVQL